MEKNEKIIMLTKLIDENLTNLDKLKKEKEILKEKYSKNPQNEDIIYEISILEKKYAYLYKKSLELNKMIKKITEGN